MKPVYFCDMDGVLAKWNTQASEEETHMPGYFLAREVDLTAVTMVRVLKDNGADVHILSAVYEDAHSANEKRAWLKNNGLGDVDVIFVPYGENKHDYIDTYIQNGLPVLVDDYSKNLQAWENQGYLPIKYMNGINNLPKLSVEDGVVRITADTWSGYSIDNRMSVGQMYTALTSIAEAIAKEAA